MGNVAIFNDRRLETIYWRIRESIVAKGSSTVHQLGADLKEQTAYYRFVNNNRVEERTLISRESERLSRLVCGKQLLV